MAKKSVKSNSDETIEDMEVFIELGDRSIQVILREVSEQDLALSLKSVSDAVRDVIMRNMSRPAATKLREEMEFMGPAPAEKIEAAQTRILEVIERMLSDGEIIRIQDESPSRRKPEEPTSLKSLVEQKKISERLSAEMIEILVCLGEKARRDGILSLQDDLPLVDDDFLTHGLRFIIDGTDPELIEKMLKTRIDSFVHEYERRLSLILTGLMGIQAGDNPRILANKCWVHSPFLMST